MDRDEEYSIVYKLHCDRMRVSRSQRGDLKYLQGEAKSAIQSLEEAPSKIIVKRFKDRVLVKDKQTRTHFPSPYFCTSVGDAHITEPLFPFRRLGNHG